MELLLGDICDVDEDVLSQGDDAAKDKLQFKPKSCESQVCIHAFHLYNPKCTSPNYCEASQTCVLY